MKSLHSRKEMSLTGIYRIINLVNNKSYVGSAAKSFKRRLWEHCSDLRRNNHCNNYLQKAFNKYREENFVFTIIEYCPPEQCVEREQYWLDYYQPFSTKGYNICKIAGTTLGYRHNEVTIKKMKEIGKSKPINPKAIRAMQLSNKGKKNPKSAKRASETFSIPVIQLDLEGNFIKEWKSATEATKSFGLSKTDSNISACTRGKCKSARGYLWIKKQDYNPNKKYSYNNKQGKTLMKTVYQYDKDGNFIREWENGNQAAKELQINSQGIYNCLWGKNKTCAGYKWYYNKL